MSVLDGIGGALMLAGALLTLLAAIGLHRFPDIFARMHAATKPATLGLVLLVAGASLVVGRGPVALKLGLAAALQFITAPVASHMVGRAAYRSGVELSPETVLDELATRPQPPGGDGPSRPGTPPAAG